MPPIAIYHVNFANGNLAPDLDVHGWGAMVQSPPVAGVIESQPESRGVSLRYTRQMGTDRGENRLHIPLPPVALPSTSRLITRVGFDKPRASTRGFSEGATVEPWAVALRVRFGTLGMVPGAIDGVAHVSCQFHPTGVRLNTPGALQKDPAGVIDGPLDYTRYYDFLRLTPPRFTLEHAFCGYHGTIPPQHNPHVTGSGSLTLLGKQDHRVYSKGTFSGVAGGAFIKELSVILTMTDGRVGWISARIRFFTLFLQSSMPNEAEDIDV